MADLVYPPVIASARALFRVLDIRVTVDGAEHIPRSGGAVVATNHVSYLDFIFCGFGALPAKRLWCGSWPRKRSSRIGFRAR